MAFCRLCSSSETTFETAEIPPSFIAAALARTKALARSKSAIRFIEDDPPALDEPKKEYKKEIKNRLEKYL